MLIDFEPGDYVTNPANKDWGIGQVQSILGNKVTVNFENFGNFRFGEILEFGIFFSSKNGKNGLQLVAAINDTTC